MNKNRNIIIKFVFWFQICFVNKASLNVEQIFVIC